MDEGKVKRLTGSDKLKVRFMRGDMFEFSPTQTFFVCIKNKPVVRNTDDGIWRWVKLVPFEQKFTGQRRDKQLPKKLKKEKEGILVWLVQGAVTVYQQGIADPKKMQIASQKYRDEFDLVGRFIDQCCVRSNYGGVQSSRLYRTYQAWCEESSEFQLDNRRFKTEMLRKGFEWNKSGVVM